MVSSLAKTTFKLLCVIGMMQMLSACTSSQPRTHLAMVDSTTDPRFAHLYSAIESNGYKNPAFSWVATSGK